MWLFSNQISSFSEWNIVFSVVVSWTRFARLLVIFLTFSRVQLSTRLVWITDHAVFDFFISDFFRHKFLGDAIALFSFKFHNFRHRYFANYFNFLSWRINCNCIRRLRSKCLLRKKNRMNEYFNLQRLSIRQTYNFWKTVDKFKPTVMRKRLFIFIIRKVFVGDKHAEVLLVLRMWQST